MTPQFAVSGENLPIIIFISSRSQFRFKTPTDRLGTYRFGVSVCPSVRLAVNFFCCKRRNSRTECPRDSLLGLTKSYRLIYVPFAIFDLDQSTSGRTCAIIDFHCKCDISGKNWHKYSILGLN